MRLKDFAYRLKEFWSEFRKDKSGIVGLVILALALMVVVFEPVILPWKETNTTWRSIDYWQDNSANAPPSWTNFFRKHKMPVTEKLYSAKPVLTDMDGGMKMAEYSFTYHYTTDTPPLDLIFHTEGYGDVPVNILLTRPDGQTLELAQHFDQGLSGQDIRIALDNEGTPAALEFLRANLSEEAVQRLNNSNTRATSILFNTLAPDMVTNFKPLKGDYKIVAQALLLDPATSRLEDPYLMVSGSVSGLLGTDDGKRDLMSGLIAGLKWALLIGILTSITSVMLGVMYGIVSAYFGGVVDNIMMFFYQIMNSIPVLPVLIVISAIFKPNIYILIGVMVLFFWTGSVMTVRSMALQIKEETYIEAAKALGAKRGRIIFRHMMPLLIPYSFASMALSVPSAIVYESSVSLLGLGDATIVTWGQILHDAMQGAAILKGMWWWLLPPGLLIAIMGMTFAFIGFAMDKILHPKLKTR